METEIIDKLYLELSQITSARNERELLATNDADTIFQNIEWLISIKGIDGPEIQKCKSLAARIRNICSLTTKKNNQYQHEL